MAILKCKMCGGDVELAPDKTFGTCEYCGSTMTFPKTDDERRAAMFNRGNHFRRMGEFDKAMAVYEQIVQEDDTDAEAHWCCVLCRFGIEYVEDPATYEYVPTCHRASFESILQDVDYLAALEHSDGLTRRQYQKDAARIAEIQKSILATSRNEKPFDVFICYKETDAETGKRSRDSLDAQEVYYRLTEKGYRVFFSRITLEDKAGTEYEPYIFAALNSARVMIVLGSKPEHFSAVWVKNEWSRFLSLMKKDRSRLLIPCYRNMDPYDLPEQLGMLQSYDMTRIGFIQDLIRGVEKVLCPDEPKSASAPARETVVLQGGGPNTAALLKRGQQALEDGDWAQAKGFFDQVLSMDAENADAFLGMALAGAQCRNAGEYIEKAVNWKPREEALFLPVDEQLEEHKQRVCSEMTVPGYLSAQQLCELYIFDTSYPSGVSSAKQLAEKTKRAFESDRDLSRAFRFSAGETGTRLEAFRKDLDSALRMKIEQAEQEKKRAEEAKKEQYDSFLKEADALAEERYRQALDRRETEYQSACRQFESSMTAEHFRLAASRFQALQGYRDSDVFFQKSMAEAERHRRMAEQAEQEKKARTKKLVILAGIAAAVILAAVLLMTQVILPASRYKKAEAMLDAGDYSGAIAAFGALGSYKDSAERLSAATAAREEELNAAAAAREEELNAAAYGRAAELLKAGRYDEAIKAFEALGSYRDSAAMVQEAAYQYAKDLFGKTDYKNALSVFNSLNGYKDSADQAAACEEAILEETYSEAQSLMEKQQYLAAARIFTGIKDYKDSGDVAHSCVLKLFESKPSDEALKYLTEEYYPAEKDRFEMLSTEKIKKLFSGGWLGELAEGGNVYYRNYQKEGLVVTPSYNVVTYDFVITIGGNKFVVNVDDNQSRTYSVTRYKQGAESVSVHPEVSTWYRLTDDYYICDSGSYNKYGGNVFVYTTRKD